MVLPEASYSKCVPVFPSQVTSGPVPVELLEGVVISQFPLESAKVVPVHPVGT